VKEPVPEPFSSFVLATVGLGEVLQQTPLAVTAEPPSELTAPPLVAAVWVMFVTAAVATVAGIATVIVAVWLSIFP